MTEHTYSVRTEIPEGIPVQNAVLTPEGIKAVAPILVQLFIAALALAPEQKGSEPL